MECSRGGGKNYILYFISIGSLSWNISEYCTARWVSITKYNIFIWNVLVLITESPETIGNIFMTNLGKYKNNFNINCLV